MSNLSKTGTLVLGWLMLLLACPAVAQAQNIVSGVVYEDDGTTPLTGATVQVKGTTNATSTDIDGKYTLKISGKNPTLVYTFIGFQPSEEKVDGRTTINVVMKTNSVQLDDVVVTALGISREQKSLGYAVTKVSNEDLTSTVSGNWLNAMNGKVAGLNMTSSNAGPTGSVRVTLRGEQSLNYGSNEALVVVAGVPLSTGAPWTAAG
ncbi:MAG: carboxypeptidase-like regulatory domain-containing protein, partial [Muribaculaceae bacterium]|nr:carboxypeptidase-like regulatory domain-containing protein [Muribaculaceae bacterium]